MKASVSVVSVAFVVVLTLVAATFRVSTAPDRLRMRLDTARDACVSKGGAWVRVGREEFCQTAEERKKV